MPALGTLPKGRHGLSREEVETSQRTRLLQAAIELGTERGFASLTLTDIVSRAGVARSTFYEYFADKQQCFLEAFDYAADRVLERVLAIGPPPAGAFASPVDGYIATLLDLALEEPGLVRLVAADADTLGPVAAERQRAIRGRLADDLINLRDYLRSDDPRLAPITHTRALAIVGAITEVLKHNVYAAGIDALPALRPELATIVLALLEAPPARPNPATTNSVSLTPEGEKMPIAYSRLLSRLAGQSKVPRSVIAFEGEVGTANGSGQL
jgi:AcrR family transcriptional regulator